MLLRPTTPSQSILGYVLKERIGAGGYGEVWAAEAPGGLSKAVKLVYGYHDENRAQNELKSLNRIKEVRHAFLLSLERIEIVDGRLVVVTELAERSLKDRFCECIESGIAGIPRDELLVYIRDAAEALDFINEAHSLQHLDVKPENLLLVGGHVKVADFGLVKDFNDGTQSLMSGLTPMYAPPELFDGSPSRFSDQYSLAIVFQEMLTGTRPFPGRTAAQLATQHVHGTPSLAGLPHADQKTIRRALAKNPEARFPNCRELVDELLQRTIRRPVGQRRPGESLSRDELERHETPGMTPAVAPAQLASLAAKMNERKMPPLKLEASDATFRPTLFIGIGETATNVMRQLKYRLRERCGSDTPSIKVLCLDTDVRDLVKASTGTDLRQLDSDEILGIPLRTSAEYRAKPKLRLDWLSRRWIYNVPKSCQTECLRPLGRLAFVDHHKAVFKRLETLVDQITDPAAIQRTAEAMQLPAGAGKPRVVVLASISGGVGSGMVADVAYAARTVLGEGGFGESEVMGFLMYSLGRSATRRDLTAANAYCCLSELYHFSQSGGFPGDTSCELPEFSDTRPFDSAYVIDFGNDPLPDEYDATVDSLAEYLFLDTASPCGSYFDACRHADESPNESWSLRTLGLVHSGRNGGDLVSFPANRLSERVVRSWLDASPHKEENQQSAESRAATVLHDLRMDSKIMPADFDASLLQQMDRNPLHDLLSRLAEVSLGVGDHLTSEDTAAVLRKLEEVTDESLGMSKRVSSGRFATRAVGALQAICAELVSGWAEELESRLLRGLDAPGERVWHTELVVACCRTQLEELLRQLSGLRSTATHGLQSIESQIEQVGQANADPAAGEAVAPCQLAALAERYGILRYNSLKLTSCLDCIGQVVKQLCEISDRLTSLRRDLERMADFLRLRGVEDEQAITFGVAGQAGIIPLLVNERIMAKERELVRNIDERVQDACFQGQSGLSCLASRQCDDRHGDLMQAIYRQSRVAVAEQLSRTDLNQVIVEENVPQAKIDAWLRYGLQAAMPHLLHACGGASRLLVALPTGTEKQAIAQSLANLATDQPKYLSTRNSDVVICYEVGQIPATQVAASLLHNCPESIDLVNRIHTRTDVKWRPIIRLE